MAIDVNGAERVATTIRYLAPVPVMGFIHGYDFFAIPIGSFLFKGGLSA